MPILLWVAALRVTGSPGGSSPAAEYAVFILAALAVGLIVLIFIRAGARSCSKHQAAAEGARWEGYLQTRRPARPAHEKDARS